jgi:multimeric flavodoxin WrbA
MSTNQQIIILKGSPRQKGNSSTLADQAAEGARAAGAQVESFIVHDMDIRPCDACDACREMGGGICIVKDDMQILYPKLLKADAILIASPVYWFNVSAQTKLWIDRLYAFGSAELNLLSGKRFGIILTYEDPDPFVSGAVNPLRALQDMIRYIHAELVGMVYGSAHHVGDVLKQPELMQKAYQLGQKLALHS